MPIQIISSTFTDVFGNNTSFYRANVGDRNQVALLIRSAIRMTTHDNPWSVDATTNTMSSAGTSWIEEGFRVNDWVVMRKHNAGGGVMNTWYTQVLFISQNGMQMQVGNIQHWYSFQQGSTLSITAVVANGNPTLRQRSDLDVLINHVNNAIPGSQFSLIDAEPTRVQFTGVSGMAISSTINGVLVGNQSGQFLQTMILSRGVNDANGWNQYFLTPVFTQSGLYNQSNFLTGGTLKLWLKLEWASYAGEPFARNELIWNEQANLGWFNMAHATSVVNSSLVSGVSEIDWSIPSTFDLVVDGPITGLGIGAMYQSINPAYYKNQLVSQDILTMSRPTIAVSVNTFTSYLNPDGAGYTITVNSIGTVGTVHTINVTFTPNADFITFFDNVEDGDRLFHLWVKCGNINWLAFSDQLTKSPPVGGPLIMVQDYGYLDHSENITDPIGNKTGFIADTEDDIAYVGKFRLEKNEVYQQFNVRLEAFNTVTDEDFTLQQISFGFGAMQISADGRYLIDETATITTELPTTSVKREARFTLDPTIDVGTQYGVKIYVPWLLNWRYWQQLSGVNVAFYPDQNKNWEQYDNLADWEIRTELELIQDGLAYVHDNVVVINPYDDEANIASSQELQLLPGAVPVTVIPTGAQMTIIATEVKSTPWDPLLTWGMITVEQKENMPRWICSTAVNFDNNSNNPLTPESGLLIDIVYPNPTTAVMRCNFDANKLNLIGGGSVGQKIKEREAGVSDPIINGNSTAIAGYSVFKISSDIVYTGDLMIVRRSGDNAELGIGYVTVGSNILLDTATLLTFAGGGNAYVAQWYSQTGLGEGADQNILSRQPIIVRGGVLVTDPDNGFPALLFDGVDDFFNLKSNIVLTTEIMSSWVFRRTQAALLPPFLSVGFGNIVGGSLPFTSAWFVGVVATGVSAVPQYHDYNNGDIGSFINIMDRDVTNAINVRQNGVSLTELTAVNSALSLTKIGLMGKSYHNGLMQELTLWKEDINVPLIEANTNFRFQIF